MTAEPAIAVVGSLNIDLIAYAQRVPGPGETVMGDRFAMGFGGKGANQAVMAARLGARVSMVGALGENHPVILQMPAGKGFTWCYAENRYV